MPGFHAERDPRFSSKAGSLAAVFRPVTPLSMQSGRNVPTSPTTQLAAPGAGGPMHTQGAGATALLVARALGPASVSGIPAPGAAGHQRQAEAGRPGQVSGRPSPAQIRAGPPRSETLAAQVSW